MFIVIFTFNTLFLLSLLYSLPCTSFCFYQYMHLYLCIFVTLFTLSFSTLFCFISSFPLYFSFNTLFHLSLLSSPLSVWICISVSLPRYSPFSLELYSSLVLICCLYSFFHHFIPPYTSFCFSQFIISYLCISSTLFTLSSSTVFHVVLD